jgi:hypothetical protein
VKKHNRPFTPVMTRAHSNADTKAFEVALAASDRFAIIETAKLITFKFRKRVTRRKR